MLKNNFKIKLLSLIFAFFMWIFVMAEVDPIINRTIENVAVTSISNQSEIEELGLVISPESSITTQVSVRGRRSLVNSYVAKGPVIMGTIRNPQLGLNQIELAIQARDNVELTINPIRTEIALEEIASTRISITTRLLGETAEGYDANSVVVNPDSTLVEGPASLVGQVSEIIATIDVSGANKDFTQNVKLNAIDIRGNEVKDVKLQVRYVEAAVSIHKKKVVPIELLIVDGDEELKLTNYYIDPKEIQIKGEESIINEITSIKTQPLTVEQLSEAGDLIVNLNLPKGISSNIVTGKLKIDNESAYTINLEFDKNDILLNDYSEDEIANISPILPERVKLNITYDKGFENIVKQEDIKIFVDPTKSDIEASRYYFEIESSIPYLRATITPNVVNKIN